jgi:hypothetical protein
MKTSLATMAKLLTPENLQQAIRNQEQTVASLKAHAETADLQWQDAREQLRILKAEVQRRETWKRVRKLRHA